MRLILALLFTVMGGAAWGQCTGSNIANCPGPVIYKGPVQNGQTSGPAANPGDYNATGNYKINGVPASVAVNGTNCPLGGSCSPPGNGAATIGGNNGFTGNNTHSGQESFASVLGSSNVQGGSTYTFAASDCGKTIMFTGTSPVATIPASIAPAAGATCLIGVLQVGSTKVSVNGTAVSAATLISSNSYTGTSGTAGSEISLTITTVSSTATAFLNGTGS